ncbi:MAG: hypothetical protein GY711_12620 [bacterium]|nr:hypothetical protein [bacterium]
MSRRTLVALLLVACSCGCSGGSSEPKRRPLIERWPAGGLRVEGEELRKGGRWVKDGLFVFHDEGGKVVRRGGYVLGVESGMWREVYEDGATGTGEYVDGLRHGAWTILHPGGEKQEEGSYAGGLRTGAWRWYWPNGRTRSEATYVDGKKDGVVTFWGADGERQGTETWEAGEKIR